MANNITIDLSNYKDRQGAKVTPGKYRVQVEDFDMGTTKKNDPMATVSLRIVGGQFDGLTLVDRLTLTEKAMFRMVGFLQGLGIPTPKKKLQLPMAKILGQYVDVQVKDGEPYNGTIRSEIDSYIRIEKAKSKPVEEEVEEDLDEDFDESEVVEPVADDEEDFEEGDDEDFDESEVVEPVADDEEDFEEGDDEEEEEIPDPPKKRAPAKKTTTRKKKPEPEPEEDEDLDLDDVDDDVE